MDALTLAESFEDRAVAYERWLFAALSGESPLPSSRAAATARRLTLAEEALEKMIESGQPLPIGFMGRLDPDEQHRYYLTSAARKAVAEPSISSAVTGAAVPPVPAAPVIPEVAAEEFEETLRRVFPWERDRHAVRGLRGPVAYRLLGDDDYGRLPARATRQLAERLCAAAAADLRIAAPRLRWFTGDWRVDPKAGFEWERCVGFMLNGHDAIFVLAELTPEELSETVPHEVWHIANPGAGEDGAERYGEAWRYAALRNAA